ncbi:Udp-glycosyltransferase 89b2 [Thalictrum thalictroides]|uniref:Udp-glycosyltransferase 89b2 n=1 Tax=Thalictrum thalictroides TaxID=46969 RepID=A0A7J6VAX4_THATH|nr:Udp-glycosyltransferase 89b2 [Thalictrum thalictroides]
MTTGAHILVFPYPAQGHMIPLLDLTHQLALRGLTITILVTPKNLPILTPLLSTHPNSIQTLVLPFPSHPSIPSGVENTKDLPNGSFIAMMRAMSQLSNPIIHWFQSHSSPPIAILSDMFLGLTNQLASQLGIKHLVFSPSGALTLSMSNSLWTDFPKNPNDENALVEFPNVPNSPKFPWFQLSASFRKYVQGDPNSEFLKNVMQGNMSCWAIVCNSFSELESVYLNHLKKDIGDERVFAVGPLLPPQDVSKERGGSSSIIVKDILSWLDTCPDKSVVYVCFGSQVVLKNQQMDELASGLEKSGVRFVWCTKEATKGHVAGDYGLIPAGFEDRMASRGFVIRGWAPQVVILNHRAVGSFLTHCGWNSVLESVAAGVPMLMWPMGADQYYNANLLVDHMNVGVRVCEGALTIPNADELARKMAESVGGGIVSERCEELSQAAVHAVKEGGSSFKDLDALVKELCVLNVEGNK